MNYQLPKSMPVYDIGQFHLYTQNSTRHDFAIAERMYATVERQPQFIVLHQMGEYTVMEYSPGSTNYYIPNSISSNFTLELAPRYHTRNTAIERYTKNEWERLVWIRPSGRVDTLAARWRGEDWEQVSSDMSKDYATALFEHHTVGSSPDEYPYLKQNRDLFPGDLELLQQEK